jgi:cysteine-rich repeat protein
VTGRAVFVDSHCHIMPDRLAAAIRKFFDDRMGWGRLAYPRVLKDDVLAAQREAGTDAFWALPYAHRAGVAASLNEWTAAEVASLPGAVDAATFHPDDADLPALVRRAFDVLGLRVAKLHCSVGAFAADDPRLEPLWIAAEERAIPVVVHAGHDVNGRTHAHELAPIDRIARAHAGLRLVIAHAGLPDAHAAFDLLDRHPALHADLTSAHEWAYPLPVERLEALHERLLFGSDCPNTTARIEASAAAMRALPLSARATRDPRRERGAALRREDQGAALRGTARQPAADADRAGRCARRTEPPLVRSADASRLPRHAAWRVAPGRVAAALALVATMAGAALAAPAASCVGRYVLLRASGSLLDRARDTIVLDATSAVIDPLCGAGDVEARPTRAGSRIAVRWRACRGARVLRLRVRASADCTLLRGAVVGRGRRSRIVAVASSCGDGIVDSGRGERCDDGNVLDGDACDATCGRCSGPATFASTWDAIQANLFDDACTACHGAQASGGLDLRAPGTYARIVGMPVPGVPSLDEIRPGDRATSFVWLKIAKGAGGYDDVLGPGMPIGTPLPPEVVEAFGRWVDAGAPETGVVPDTDALTTACR